MDVEYPHVHSPRSTVVERGLVMLVLLERRPVWAQPSLPAGLTSAVSLENA